MDMWEEGTNTTWRRLSMQSLEFCTSAAESTRSQKWKQAGNGKREGSGPEPITVHERTLQEYVIFLKMYTWELNDQVETRPTYFGKLQWWSFRGLDPIWMSSVRDRTSCAKLPCSAFDHHSCTHDILLTNFGCKVPHTQEFMTRCGDCPGLNIYFPCIVCCLFIKCLSISHASDVYYSLSCLRYV